MPETITIPYPEFTAPRIIYAGLTLLIMMWSIQRIRDDIKIGSFKSHYLCFYASVTFVMPLILSGGVGFAMLLGKSDKAAADAQTTLVESIPEEWNRVIEVLHSDELRNPAKLRLVREHVEGNVFPDLTIKQQNYIIESTFKCGFCGCGESCERNRNQLSDIIAVYVNPFPEEPS